MPNPHPMRCGPQASMRRAAQMAASCSWSVWRGLCRGRLERSRSASGPPSRNRRTHLETVARETRNKRATSAWGQPATPVRQLDAGHGGQACVTMGHEGPPVTAGFRSHNSNSEAPHLSTTSMGTTPRSAHFVRKATTTTAMSIVRAPTLGSALTGRNVAPASCSAVRPITLPAPSAPRRAAQAAWSQAPRLRRGGSFPPRQLAPRRRVRQPRSALGPIFHAPPRPPVLQRVTQRQCNHTSSPHNRFGDLSSAACYTPVPRVISAQAGISLPLSRDSRENGNPEVRDSAQRA